MKTFHLRGSGTPAALALILCAAGVAAQAQPAMNQYAVNTFWASGGANPRVLMRGPQGRLWTGLSDGTIRILEDTDQDGVADSATLFVGSTWSPHGLAWRANGSGWDIFVAHLTSPVGGTGQITRFTDQNGDDVFESVQTIIQNMPTGAHQVNNIRLDPSGNWLYFSLGATSNSQPGGGALIGRVSPQAQNLAWGAPGIEIYATGLRNAWGMEFHPGGALFAVDNGRDDLGPSAPPDELNLIVQGGDYGFPAVSGTPPPGSNTIAPVANIEPHAAACGLAFDDHHVMTGFENQVFMAWWGAWVGNPPGKITQGTLVQDAGGTWHYDSWDLLVGCGRPLDVEQGADGAIYFGVQSATAGWPVGVYRIAPVHGVALRLAGTPFPGGQVTATVKAPSKSGHSYLLGASLGTGPIPTPLGNIGLSPDAILQLSLVPNPFFGFQRPGVLNASGSSSGSDTIQIPAIPGLSGLTLYLAAVTIHPSNGQLTGISPTARLRIF